MGGAFTLLMRGRQKNCWHKGMLGSLARGANPFAK